ncbi:MAG: hypothetical protein U1G08_09140 [Verrucomicrobiota bacterium]
MKTTTLIAKQDLLEEMSTALASPRIVSPRRDAKPIRIHVPLPTPRQTGPKPQRLPGTRTWDTVEAAEGRVFEIILKGALLLAAAGSLAWLAYGTLRFLLAFQGFAAGLRLALT